MCVIIILLLSGEGAIAFAAHETSVKRTETPLWYKKNMQTRIDHIVIGAGSLKQGVDYVRNCFGVDMPYGGEHRKMGTHNHLMQLGDGVFLEVIAINHEIEPPNRPR